MTINTKEKEIFEIQGLGGRRELEGEIAVNGAKNCVLKIMASVFLFEDEFSIKNVPDIEDVSRMAELLEGMGISVEHETNGGNGGLTLRPEKEISGDMPEEISKRFRASVVATGPLLGRMGEVSFPHPGGCVIGARPIDLFLEGYRKMGAEVEETERAYRIHAKNGLRGAEIFFRVPSVGATETLMMAAVLAKGKTILRNAAMEPEIISLAEFLNESGAKIVGAGTPTIEVDGRDGELLKAAGKVHELVPDRLETGSFLLLAALAGRDVTVTNCNPDHVRALLEELEYSGLKVEIGKSTLRINQNSFPKELRGVNIKTHEYPGFPTDLQAPMLIYLTQTAGESLVFETIFEGRLGYVSELQRMGADILVMDTNRVQVKGPTPLRGRELESPDIRAGLAYILAGIIASGKTIIHNVYFVDRGYATIESRLRSIGVAIERKKEI